MEAFDAEAFHEFIEENGVYGFFETPITLKSGRKSHFYANWRRVTSDVFLAGMLADHLIAFVRDRNIPVDTFYGVPEGATKLGILAQYIRAKNEPGFGKGSHVLSMGRARPKAHGEPADRYFVGRPGGDVVVIEDVTTTGGSLAETLEGLGKAGVKVSAVISLTDRMEKRDDGLSVEQFISRMGLPFHAMSTALTMLPRVFSSLDPGPEIKKAIEKEFAEYGVQPLRLPS